MTDLFKMLGLDDKPATTYRTGSHQPNLSAGSPKETSGKPTGLNILDTDKWDTARGREAWEKLDAGLRDRTVPAAMTDFYGCAWKHQPEAVNQCPDPLLQQFVETMLENPEYKALHASTVCDDVASGLAATQFAQEFSRFTSNQSQPKPAPKSEKEAQRQARQDERACRAAVGAAVHRAEQDIEEMEEAMAALGCGKNEGNKTPLNPQQVVQAFHRVRNDYMIRRVVELAGRYRRMAQAKQRQKAKHGYDDMVGLTLADDVSRLLPEELALLCDDGLLGLEAQRRYLESEMLAYDYRGVERIGKGPIVVWVDESDSMSNGNIYKAKALALAMAWIAKHQNRWCCLAGFASSCEGHYLALRPGHWNEAKLLDWTSHFFRGGTDLDQPLVQMPNVYWPQMIQQGLREGQTDMILITDAQFGVPDDMEKSFKAWKQTKKVKLISLVLAGGPGELDKVSDEVHVIHNLDVDNAAVGKCLAI